MRRKTVSRVSPNAVGALVPAVRVPFEEAVFALQFAKTLWSTQKVH
jgi:hypothetical protein